MGIMRWVLVGAAMVGALGCKSRKAPQTKATPAWYGVQQWSDLARKTWELPFFRIVTARWLQEELASVALSAEYVPNAVDLEFFRPLAPIEARDPYTIAMLYSNSHWKASENGLQALRLARKAGHQLRVILFSPAKLKRPLESWMHWKGQVPHGQLVEIYNRASIFLCTSIYEGWGLPGFEAMACGCALVSTRHNGAREYAEHDISALLAPVGNVEILANHICRLISDKALRMRIAKQGMESVQRFTWERSVRLFEQALLKAQQPA